METPVCGDLRLAGNILLYSVNHMIITIQWSCEIKHCDHSQAPQVNGNTCLRCLRHTYCTCPIYYPSTYLGCCLRLRETLVWGACGHLQHMPQSLPQRCLERLWLYGNQVLSFILLYVANIFHSFCCRVDSPDPRGRV